MTVQRNPEAMFHEVQYLRQQRLMVLVLPAGLFLIGFFVYAMVRQLVVGDPVGDEPMSDAWLIVAGTFYILLGALLLILYFQGRLITEVRPQGIFVRFIPFHRRFKGIMAADIAEYKVMTYRPIRDFGGFGIRVGPKGRAYNVAGNRGVYLTLKNGKRLLIGSQKPDSMAEAIRSIV